MATGHFFKTSADVGAPVLSGTIGAALPCIRFALDTANPASEWEEVFTGTNKMVVRAKTGERRYLRFDDSANTACYVRAYESMTDVDTGIDMFPTIAQRSAVGYYLWKSNQVSTVARAWRCVGDSRYFVFVNSTNGVLDEGKLAFGEATMFDPLDAYPTIINASYGTTSGINGGGALIPWPMEYAADTSSLNFYAARSRDGVNRSVACAVREIGGYTDACSLAQTSVLVLRQPVIVDGGGGSTPASAGYDRGVFPYLYVGGGTVEFIRTFFRCGNPN